MKKKILYVQIPSYGDGDTVGRDTIKKIRKQLQLDDNNGVDSHAFYSKKPVIASEFIAHYRKTLQRLAKW